MHQLEIYFTIKIWHCLTGIGNEKAEKLHDHNWEVVCTFEGSPGDSGVAFDLDQVGARIKNVIEEKYHNKDLSHLGFPPSLENMSKHWFREITRHGLVCKLLIVSIHQKNGLGHGYRVSYRP